jgi:hypothetical protein
LASFLIANFCGFCFLDEASATETNCAGKLARRQRRNSLDKKKPGVLTPTRRLQFIESQDMTAETGEAT